MEYRRLGKAGLQLSELSFGSWITFGNQIGDNTSEELMKTAYDAGVNFFDNAEIYANGQSEIVMGNILSKMGWARDTYTVSSKVFFGAGGKLPTQTGLHRKHIFEAAEAALKRLQVDYLDLYFCHRPDKQTPIEETVWSMHQLIMQGKILYWGTSEWSAQEIMEAHMFAERHHLIGPTMEQPQYNMLHREKMEKEFFNIFRTVGMGTTIWSPLASGLLTGKYAQKNVEEARLHREELKWLKDKQMVEDVLQKVDQVVALAGDLNMTPAQLGVAWCLKNKDVSTVILGASKVSQLKENLQAAEMVDKLSPDVMEEIDTMLQNKPIRPTF